MFEAPFGRSVRLNAAPNRCGVCKVKVCSATSQDSGRHGILEEWLGLLDTGESGLQAGARGRRSVHRARVSRSLTLATRLSTMSSPQLTHVQPLLAQSVLDATLRARAINGTNQGRSREEKLTAKLLAKEHTDLELDEIDDAILEITTPQGSKRGSNPAVDLAMSWCDRLLARPMLETQIEAMDGGGIAALESEISELVIVADMEVSEFRALLRKARQTKDDALQKQLSHHGQFSKVTPTGKPAVIPVHADGKAARQEVPEKSVSVVQMSKAIAKKQAAKRARSTLLKWLTGIADVAIHESSMPQN